MTAKRAICIVAALTASILTPNFAQADTLEDVKKSIHEKSAKFKTLQYKMRLETQMETSQFKMKSTTTGTAEYMRQGDAILSRVEQTTQGSQTFGKTETKLNSKTLMIGDGKHNYMLTDSAGTKFATKSNVDPKNAPSPFNAMGHFKTMEGTYVLKLMSEETVDGLPCYVIEMSPKDAAMKAVMGRTVSYYDKKTGVAIKTVSYDPKGKKTNTMTVTDIKVDASISADRFVFKAPAGVEVQDNSKG